ncbi:hypothetical protein H072_3054 [Dactylellina haptotyla CBS 200.50]|uniref:Rab-GAP TBC domain-containing protein n=1 Tax=Dactylellina haptotyla (strain CBS 200.50) TaxID=1284197 RepID=S8C5J3_DACHA|nr:hypothetical protein H072_3054 [Dactylellina haptotyla CBS 200.50]
MPSTSPLPRTRPSQISSGYSTSKSRESTGSSRPGVERVFSQSAISRTTAATPVSSAATSTRSLHGSSHPIALLLSREPTNVAQALKDLRYLILTEGIPADTDGMSAFRIYIWSILLGVEPLSAKDYLRLVHKGPSQSYAKIRDDTFRTLATDPLFHRKVSEASLTRLLNCYVLSREHATRHRDTSHYVQGMNVIAAPFMYAARSEHEAFALFHTFLVQECPAYTRPTLDGVHRGLKLVDSVLEAVDEELFSFLEGKNLLAKLYAFPSVMTFSACTPPLPEVCVLWDFLIAYGPYLNIICVVAQLLMMKDELMEMQSPMKHLRQFPPLKAREIISSVMKIIPQLSENLFQEIVEHAKQT